MPHWLDYVFTGMCTQMLQTSFCFRFAFTGKNNRLLLLQMMIQVLTGWFPRSHWWVCLHSLSQALFVLSGHSEVVLLVLRQVLDGEVRLQRPNAACLLPLVGAIFTVKDGVACDLCPSVVLGCCPFHSDKVLANVLDLDAAWTARGSCKEFGRNEWPCQFYKMSWFYLSFVNFTKCCHKITWS